MADLCVDASVLMTAWNETYPIDVIPSLWNQLSLNKDKIVIIKPIFDEIGPAKAYNAENDPVKRKSKFALSTWLLDNHFEEIDINDDVELLALELERQYEVNNISKGVGAIDVKLISYAKIHGKTIVTLEHQPNLPSKLCNYKIPTICKAHQVKYIDFIHTFRKLGIKI